MSALSVSGPGQLPSKMKALFLTKHITDYKEQTTSECLEVVQVDLPQPGPGQVLVQVHRSPVNPSDLSVLSGRYPSGPLPHGLGREGSGLVIMSGGGEEADGLVGKRVGVSAGTDASRPSHIWAEYTVVPVSTCVVLPDDVSYEQGCALFVNPLTVIGFVNIAKAGGHQTILHTAAASALGKMLIAYCKRNGIEVIGVVRRAPQKEELLQLGAAHVIDTSVDEEAWTSELRRVCEEKKCTLGFDAVGGPMASALMRLMPPKSTLRVYGGLSGQRDMSINLSDVLFGEKVLAGFWRGPYFQSLTKEQQQEMYKQAAQHCKDDFSFKIARLTTLADLAKDLGSYTSDMSQGKLVICIAKQ